MDANPAVAAPGQTEKQTEKKYSIAPPQPERIPTRMENLARGKEALTRLLGSRDPSAVPQWHAMHRYGLGWISFLWEAGPRGELGIAHLIEGRSDHGKNAAFGNARLTGKALAEFVTGAIPSIIVDGRLGRWYQVGSQIRRAIFSGKGTVVLQPVLDTSVSAQKINFIATAFPGKGKEMPTAATPLTQAQAENRIRELTTDAKGRGAWPYSMATQQRPSADGTPSTWVGPSAILTVGDLGRAGSGDATLVPEAGQAGKAVIALRAELAAHPLGSLSAQLIDAGKVRIVETAHPDAPAGAQGWTEADGAITLVAGAIPKGKAMAVLLHEAFHAGARPLLGEAAWGKLTRGAGDFISGKGDARRANISADDKRAATHGATFVDAAKIKAVQECLIELGYHMAGRPDGRAGPKTAGAIAAFQKENGFPVTGEITDELIKELAAAHPLEVAPDRAEGAPEGSRIVAGAKETVVAGGSIGITGALGVSGPLLDQVEEAKSFVERAKELVEPVRASPPSIGR